MSKEACALRLGTQLLRVSLFLMARMCIGEVRRLDVPSDLAYGTKGAPPRIPRRLR